MLLVHGADPNVPTETTIPRGEPIINYNIHRGTLEVTELLLKFGVQLCANERWGVPALHLCASLGRPAHAEKLIAAGADVHILDRSGYPPLFTAVCGKSIEMVKLLMERSDLNFTSEQGVTALLIMFQGNFNDSDSEAAEFMSLLLEKGLDLEASCHFAESVITAAVSSSAFECVEVCIKAGSKLDDVLTIDRKTVLNCLLDDYYMVRPAKREKAVHLTELLIKAGVDVNLRNYYGTTSLESAVNSANVPGAWLLLQANCSVKITRKVGNARQFMVKAIKQNAQSCAVFVFGDFCQTTEDQQLFFDLSQTKKVMVNGELVDLTRPPLSLARLCRLAVRATLPSGAAFPPAVDKLPLPRYTKDYVALRV